MDIGYFLIGVVAVVFYFLPTIIGRNKANSNALFALNLLAGWTILGWIVAIVWAYTKDAPKPPPFAAAPKPEAPDLATYQHLKRLRDEGVITQEEFLQKISNPNTP